MGALDSPVHHWIVTVHCPVRATSADLLGFGEVDRWSVLSSCCTGQSCAIPDSPVTSDFCATLFTIVDSAQSTISAQGVLAPLAHRTVR
jgi:hypothetical protein